MSLSIDGVWKSGVWAITAWADGVWSEGVTATAITGGKGDNVSRGTIKPTGLEHRKKLTLKKTDRIVEESREIQAEIAGRLAKEFTEETEVAVRPANQMSMVEIEAEIGVLLHRKVRAEEEEILLLLLMAAL